MEEEITTLYKADLHVHSSFSNKAAIWAMKKINCPESYTPPLLVYSEAKKKGMHYVTVTDHNTLDGSLQIAHLPGTFLSAEITVHFPENGCKAHVVVLDISEAQFKTAMALRKNVYEMTAFLRTESIRHFVAHPLYSMSGKLTVDIVEKMLLLFEAVEIKNGSHAPEQNGVIRNVVMSLTAEKIERLADKHGLTPSGHTPWNKICVGGSDDHSGIFIARAFTCGSSGETATAFLDAIWRGQGTVGGEDGDALMLAHSIYGVAYRFYQEHIGSKTQQSPFVDMLVNKYLSAQPKKLTLREKIRFFIKKNLPDSKNGQDEVSFEETLDRELKNLFKDQSFLDQLASVEVNRKIFSITSHLANRLIYLYTKKLFKQPMGNGLFEIFRSLSTIALTHLFIAPYYIAFFNQSRDKDLLQNVKNRLVQRPSGRKEKIALFTDTLDEINGVAMTMKRIALVSEQRGIDLMLVTCNENESSFKHRVRHFKAIGDFTLPEYPELKMYFPPILDILDYVERENFTRIHISTPGTMGLLALFIGRLLSLPVTGTYHTDIPQYVGRLTDDDFMEESAWHFIIWFYNQMEEVTVPSRNTQIQLTYRGLIPEKIRPLPRWVDTQAFSPAKRNATLWKQYGLNSDVKILYVGRLSKEKNLDWLADAFMDATCARIPVHLVIAGDGPYKDELKDKLAGYPVLFTGYLRDEALSALYASADLFVFPSTTDTFGNVVLEAQASGLPVVVSDEGGPQELMRHAETGYIVKANDRIALAATVVRLISNRPQLNVLGVNARKFIEENAIGTKDLYSTIFHPQNS